MLRRRSFQQRALKARASSGSLPKQLCNLTRHVLRPHGAEELKHPEEGLYIVGMKSYGRAPTFLLLTGYEQVRSVVAALAGDWNAAREVHLELPETGVCSIAPVKEAVAGEKVSACCG